MNGYVDGVGLCGPGLQGWEVSRAILSGEQAHVARPLLLPPAAALPPAERRRAGTVVKVSLAAASEAMAGVNAAEVVSVFASSGADGDNCHAICECLASGDRLISPTRFHNSVHNAAAGYWSIASQAMTPASVVCAFDASFGAGLIEAMTLMASTGMPCLLVAYEAPYPEPLNAKRPLPSAFGLALLLSPRAGDHSMASLNMELVDTDPDTLMDAGLEGLRRSIPSARGLPLLVALARGGRQRVVIDYLDPMRIVVGVSPC